MRERWVRYWTLAQAPAEVPAEVGHFASAVPPSRRTRHPAGTKVHYPAPPWIATVVALRVASAACPRERRFDGAGDDAEVDMSKDGQEQSQARFVQICASQNDLFALDQDGGIHQYNFSAKTWERLEPSRSEDGPRRGAQRAPGGARSPAAP